MPRNRTGAKFPARARAAPSAIPTDSEILGALYSSREVRALFSDRAMLQAMLDVEAALARAEAKLGLVPRAAANAIATAARIEKIDLKRVSASARKVGYPVVGLVTELGRIAGRDGARHVHLGATTQDIVDTAMVLQMRKALARIRADLIGVARALSTQARRYRDTPMAGRTHLQHAVPITFGYKCAVWASPLAAHVERLDAAAGRAMVVQFGGAAGTLASLGRRGPKVVEALAKELRLGTPVIPWHVARDGFAEIASVLALICGSLAKFALDFALLSQSEVAEVAEPHAEGRGASSTMPQKRNPVASEAILAAARVVHALVPAMYSAMAQEHERAAGGWQSESLLLPQCFSLTAGATEHARSIAETMTIDAERMLANLNATHGLIMAEALATALTPQMGRAMAHRVVERISSRSIEERRSLRDVATEDPALRKHLAVPQVERVLDFSRYLGAAGEFVDRIIATVEALA
jgi:3-carboxy-cis,cis-muconate cycloisomerase